MAITFTASGVGAATATSGAALELLCPAVNKDEIIVAQVCHRNNSTSPTKPGGAGWEQLAGPGNAGVSVVTGRHWVFGKIADGTEGGTKISFGTAGGTDVRHGQIHILKGREAGSLLELVAGVVTTSHDTTPQMPTLKTTVKGALGLAFVYQTDNNSLSSATGESGGDWVETGENFVTAVGLDGSQQLQRVIPTGDPGTVTGGTAVAGDVDPSGVIGFEIRPKPLEVTKAVIPLDAAAGSSSASLTLKARTVIPLDPAVGTSSTSLALRAKTAIPLQPAAGSSSTSLELVGKALLALQPAAGSSSASLALSARSKIPLQSAAGTSTTSTIKLRFPVPAGYFVHWGGEWIAIPPPS